MRLLEAYCEERGVRCQQDAPLADYCTFKIGGNASLLISPKSEDEIADVCKIARENDYPLLILGKGSNILFSDRGYGGAVLHLGPLFGGITLLEDGVSVFAQSGTPLTKLCAFALEHGLSGLEFAYGIPGTVGGAVYMNAGAYGGEMKDALVSAAHITPEGERGVKAVEALGLSYRHSAYCESGDVITGATVRLRRDDPAAIKARMDDFLGRRREKQPLDYPSAGSTFKRPEGDYASALIDRCGLKGLRVGGAMVSEKHAGFLINYDRATAADMLELIARVREEVERRTGIRLECEIKMIGF